MPRNFQDARQSIAKSEMRSSAMCRWMNQFQRQETTKILFSTANKNYIQLFLFQPNSLWIFFEVGHWRKTADWEKLREKERKNWFVPGSKRLNAYLPPSYQMLSQRWKNKKRPLSDHFEKHHQNYEKPKNVNAKEISPSQVCRLIRSNVKAGRWRVLLHNVAQC